MNARRRAITRGLFCAGLMLGMPALMSVRTASGRLTADFERFHRMMDSQFGAQRVVVSRAWEQMLRAAVERSELEQVQMVSQFFHQYVRYRLDINLYGMEDYWASPLETLGHGLGDCEDYAIAKYVSLRMLGISDANLRMIYVQARIGGSRSTITQAHMVLGYYPQPNAEPLILDSLVRDIQPARDRPDLQPVFSFNAAGLWTPGGTTSVASPTARLSRWRSVLDRIENEGLVW
ncbi:transglutaminase-like cysteine peptidase [Nitrincola sp. MINF-07-Sa-05]|uniref:transglutaminase-like cysteine peptidase n=1 Tax=Nitrincola salilacus TaxID=3400273 RepID=UPI0039183323